MTEKKALISSIGRLHITDGGILRIAGNLGIEKNEVLSWCRSMILKEDAFVFRRGKNRYVRTDGCIITVNASSYTVITAKRDAQIERIARYESMMDEAGRLLSSDRRNKALPRLISSLEAYYRSRQWKKDYEDDEAGLLPPSLKRGVLSEDGLYDLLDSFRRLSE